MTLVVLQKPAYGQPCNKCGLCCTRELCQFAMGELYPGHPPFPSPEWKGPCPFLEREGEVETRCGLLLRKPDLFGPLRIGEGCYAPDIPAIL